MRTKRPINLVVCGSRGRMGKRVAALARADRRFRVAALVDKDFTGGCLGTEGFPEALKAADVAVDFSSPACAVSCAAAAARLRKPIAIGTTGLSPAQLSKIRQSAKKTAILLSPNMSPGVNLMFHLSLLAASGLKGYDLSVSETHHRLKKDRPSGTALKLIDALKQGSGASSRIHVASKRIGDVIGEHTVTLAGALEDLKIVHKARSRDLFASGALTAAKWLVGRRPGLYSMIDVVGIQ